MATAVLNIEKREKTGRNIARLFKSSGKVPGIYYAHGEPSTPILVNEKEILSLLKSGVTIIHFQYPDGTKQMGIVRELQFDPVKDDLIHVDLMGVKANEKIWIKIPIHLMGKPEGVKIGGILEHIIREIEIECLPADVPEHVEVEISNLGIHDAVHVRDLKIDKVKILTDPDQSICAVVPPTIEAEVPAPGAEVAAVAPTEPEIVGRRVKAEEPEEGAEPAKGGKEKEAKQAAAPKEKEAKPATPVTKKEEKKPEKK